MIYKRFCVILLNSGRKTEYIYSEVLFEDIRKTEYNEVEVTGLTIEERLDDFLSKTLHNFKKRTKFILVLSDGYYINRIPVPFKDISKTRKILNNLLEEVIPDNSDDFIHNCIQPYPVEDGFQTYVYSLKKTKVFNLISIFHKNNLKIVKISNINIELLNIITDFEKSDRVHFFYKGPYVYPSSLNQVITDNLSNGINSSGEIISRKILLNNNQDLNSIIEGDSREKIIEVFENSDTDADTDGTGIKTENLLTTALKSYLSVKEYFSFNFLTEDITGFSKKKKIQKPVKITIAALIILIISASAVLTVLKINRKKNQYLNYKKEARILFKTNFPETRVIIKEISQAQNILNKNKNKLNLYYKYSCYKNSFMETMKSISSILADNDAELNEVEYFKDSIRLNGIASSYEVLSSIKQKILALNFAKSYGREDYKMLNVLKGNNIEFNIEIKLRS